MSKGMLELLKIWNKKELDFRHMFTFKNQLYGSPELTIENRLPVSEFNRIRSEHDNMQIRGGIVGTEEQLIAELLDPETRMINLNTFSDLVDLFMYLPNTEKVFNQ